MDFFFSFQRISYILCPVPTMASHTLSSQESACFLFESQLIRELVETLRNSSAIGEATKVAEEFDYAAGRADVISVSRGGEVYAFEGKLEKWKVALEQARRNGCFAHYSFVVLPHRAAASAIRNSAQFAKHGVGLVVCGNGEPRVEIEPERKTPLLPWLTESARSKAT